MHASINSMKLYGKILQAKPTAMPSTPLDNSRGNLTGKVSGSLFRPS